MKRRQAAHAIYLRRSALRAFSSGVAGAMLLAVIATLIPSGGVHADSTQDTVTSSAQTVTAATADPNVSSAPFPDLKVSISQTKDLVSQGVSINFSGLAKSIRPNGDIGGTNFLQIAQCWGEDPNNPGHPDRTTCQYGSEKANQASVRDNYVRSNVVDPHDAQYSFVVDQNTGSSYESIPFRAVTGEEVNTIGRDTDGNPFKDQTVSANSNQFFSSLTTNYVPFAGADDSGSGSIKFEMQTVMQSPGLGCGTPKVNGTAAVGQSCWIVFIPRGLKDNGQNYITTSGLFWNAWQHNIAIKLDFRPVGVRCAIGSAENQLSGSELIATAVASWQPKLCDGANGAAYVLSTGNESDVLSTATTNPNAPLALTSEPLANSPGVADPLLYAPVAASGITVSFAIDRYVRVGGRTPKAYLDANYSPFKNLNITPRILAKLLTNSYLDSLPSGDKSHLGYHGSADPGNNPINVTYDPDFLSVNDAEWKFQTYYGVGVSDAITPLGRSDLADKIWSYIMSDPDARDFMEGKPDPWGMRVNPYYCTDPLVNPTGTGLQMPRRDFPKADPIDKPDNTLNNPVGGTGEINLVTWRPYVSDFDTAAYKVLRGDPNVLGAWDNGSIPHAFKKTAGALPGTQRLFGISTTASAAKYQNVTASLLNPAGQFVSPTRDSMFAAEVAMVPTLANSSVRTFDYSSDSAAAAQTAYPLTMPIYAAVNPKLLDPKLRAIYANFIKFAATQGQVPGTELGQLPLGYAPLTQGFVAQALQVAGLTQLGISAPPTVVPTPLPTSSPSVSPSVPVSTSSPTPEGPASQVVFGLPTPLDPPSGPASAAVPFGFVGGALLAVIYERLTKRRKRK